MEEVFKPDNSAAYWDDGDFIHLCDGCEFGTHKEIRLLWTLCEKDVPANAAFSGKNTEGALPNLNIITCPTCKEKTNE